MSGLPLLQYVAIDDPGYMNQPASPQSGSSGRRQLTARLLRLAHGVRAIIAECAHAQRRLTELTTSPDRYLLEPDAAPDTYAEFLFRTSGLLRREAPARTRADS